MTAVNCTMAAEFRDRYVIERELGRGGMATCTSRATCARIGR
jgi:hypothetical protein